MTTVVSRRTSMAAIAGLLVVSFGLPSASLAGPSASNSMQGEQKTSKRRPAADQITAGPCLPGQPEYDPEKCREEIKRK